MADMIQDRDEWAVFVVDVLNPRTGEADTALVKGVVIINPDTQQPITSFGGGSGGGGAGTEYAEDTVAVANPLGSMTMARRRDTLTAAEVSADGDVIALNATAKGQLHVHDADNLAAQGVTAAALDAISDAIDSQTALLTTQNGLITTQNTYVDGLEAGIGGTNTRLDTLNAAIVAQSLDIEASAESLASLVALGASSTVEAQLVLNEAIGSTTSASYDLGGGPTNVVSLLRKLTDQWAAFAADTSPAATNVTQTGGVALSKTVGVSHKSVVSTPWNKTVNHTGELIAASNRVLTSYFLENPHATDKCYVRFFNAATKEEVSLAANPTNGATFGLDAGEKANVSFLNLDFPAGLVVYVTKDLTGSTAPSAAAIVNVGYRSA